MFKRYAWRWLLRNRTFRETEKAQIWSGQRQGKPVGWTAIVAIGMSSQCQICLSVTICMYMCVCCMTVYMYSTHMHHSLVLSAENTQVLDTLVAVSAPSAQSWPSASPTTQRSQNSSEKWQILRRRQWSHKMNLEYGYTENEKRTSLSCVRLFGSPRTIQFMEFSSPEYWSG